jgi:5-formyltetrahydrofolate cyclo-ligase
MTDPAARRRTRARPRGALGEARRQALAAADRGARPSAPSPHLLGWTPWRTARVALVYLAFGSELDPLAGGLRPGLLAGARVPTRRPSGSRPPARRTTARRLQVHALDPAALERHPLGFLQPRPDAPRVPLERIDLVLVPGLCFDGEARGSATAAATTTACCRSSPRTWRRSAWCTTRWWRRACRASRTTRSCGSW